MLLGLVFPLYSDAELIQFAKLVNVSFNRDATLTAGGTANGRTIRSTSFSHSFAVDDGISKIIVSIVVSKQNTTSQVSLVDPANVKVNPLITTSLAIVFEKESPKAGQYKLTFPTTVGKYEYNVQGASEGAIEFAYSFIYQQSVRKNSPPIYMKNPFKGKFRYSKKEMFSCISNWSKWTCQKKRIWKENYVAQFFEEKV